MSSDHLEILATAGKENLAALYVAKYQDKLLEFVERIQPSIPREDKWVLDISALYGCPFKCIMCDCGEYFQGYVPKAGMLAQLDHMIRQRYPDGKVWIRKLKIHFSRMGEPSLNPDLIPLLRELPYIYNAHGLLPCIDTIAPKEASHFFDELLKIKNNLYSNGQFQLQFSLHSSNPIERKKWIPGDIWSFKEIALFGERWFVEEKDRKITLNFAVAEESVIEPTKIAEYFTPNRFLIKLTPVYPTNKSIMYELDSKITEENKDNLELAKRFRNLGFETIVYIGQSEGNQIGSNSGQVATELVDGKMRIKENFDKN